MNRRVSDLSRKNTKAPSVPDRRLTVNDYLLFLWAAALPFVWLNPSQRASGVGDRLTIADVVGLLYLLTLFARQKSSQWNHMFPKSAVVLFVIAALSVSINAYYGLENYSAFMIMLPISIFGFLLAISWAASNQHLDERGMRYLAIGIAAGCILESVVVYHDWLAGLAGGRAWFIDTMSMRVRGTFRASGQLAQYGLVVGGVLVSISAGPWGFSRWERIFCTSSGVLALMFTILAGRRSGMAAMVVFLAVWIALSLLRSKEKSKATLTSLVVALAAMAIVMSSDTYKGFVVGRIAEGAASIGDDDSFISVQVMDALRIFEGNFFLGVGWGLNREFTAERFEIHNAYLGVLTDSGLIGALCFVIFLFSIMRILIFILRNSESKCAESAHRLAALFAAQLVFWNHNRGLRDRGFFLFLGVLSMYAWYALGENRKRRLVGNR